jgi:hypothetical protein
MKKMLIALAALIFLLPANAALADTIEIVFEDYDNVIGFSIDLDPGANDLSDFSLTSGPAVPADDWRFFISVSGPDIVGLDFTLDNVLGEGLVLTIEAPEDFDVGDIELIFACGTEGPPPLIVEEPGVITVKPVPINTTMLLLGSGLIGLIGIRRMRKRS